MLDAKNYWSPKYPFTAKQWEELEQQAMVFRYLVSGVPIPPQLISTVITSSSSSRFFSQQTPLPIGWGSFQVGFGRKTDPEPGRCRRTDGKKWRCSKEAYPDSKYCEKHMNRGKNKAKNKPYEALNTTNINPNAAANASIPSFTESATMTPCFPSHSMSCCVSQSNSAICVHRSPSHSQQTTSFYPFLSPLPSPRQDSEFTTVSSESQNAPLRLMDPDLYYGSGTHYRS